MRIKMFLIFATIVGALAMLGAQGCFYRSHEPDHYGQQYGSNHTECDANGRNCMVCDNDDRNCRRVDSQYNSNQRRSGFWW